MNPLSAVLALAAAIYYVFGYTALLKRNFRQNVVIGGAAGAVPVLVGWSSVTGSLAWPPIVLFLLVFLWTPPHTWALAIRYRGDYAGAEVPMMPVVESFERTARQILAYSLATIAASGAFGLVAHMQVVYWASAATAGAVLVAFCLRLLKGGSPSFAMKVFHWSNTYLSLLFVAMAVDVLAR